MIDLLRMQHEYQYDGVTVLDGIIPADMSRELMARVSDAICQNSVHLVDHDAQGTERELDGGGRYLHHIFLSRDIQNIMPELVGVYHALLPLVSMITATDAVISPHEDSDINIKAYPPGGGTVGPHFDTNGITALLYLTDNSEAPLVVQRERSHPARGKWTEEKRLYCKAGQLLLMKGREMWHWSDPTISESKAVVVFNYYQRGDTWRPSHFDAFVYEGVSEVIPLN